MAISSIGNSSSAPDSRSTVKQTDGQAATGANTSHSRTDSQGEAQSQAVDAVSISSLRLADKILAFEKNL